MTDHVRPVDHALGALDTLFATEAAARGITVEQAKAEHYSKLGHRAGPTKRIAAIERRMRALAEEAPDLSPAQVERLRQIFRAVVGDVA